jgi:hypothetical protein
MKNRNLLLLALGALLTHFLFYNKGLGINLIFFSVLVLVLQVIHRPGIRKDWRWWIPALGTTLTALAFNLTNGEILIPIFMVSLLILAFVQLGSKNYWVLAGFHFAGSLFLSTWNFIGENLPHFGKTASAEENTESMSPGFTGPDETLKSELRVRSFVVPLGVSTLFFVLYSFANQDFTDTYIHYLKDFEPQSIFAYLVFAWLLITFCFGTSINPLLRFQDWLSDLIALRTESQLQPALEQLKEKEAIRSFGSLTILLLVLLGFEVNSCFKSDVNLAENLHGNVYAVIFSILTAILVVMYFFSGSIFQLRQIRTIKRLAFAWIGLNAVLAGIGIYKTILYISSLGLTYKRVATMEFLVSILLCLGLVILALVWKKGNEWLMERCLFVCYGLFIGFNLIGWDRQVVAYNYRHLPDRNPEYYDRLSLSAYAEYLEINPQAPYWSKNVHRKRAEFEINFHNAHWLGKTLEDHRIAKTLAQHPRPAKPSQHLD